MFNPCGSSLGHGQDMGTRAGHGDKGRGCSMQCHRMCHHREGLKLLPVEYFNFDEEEVLSCEVARGLLLTQCAARDMSPTWGTAGNCQSPPNAIIINYLSCLLIVVAAVEYPPVCTYLTRNTPS